MTRARIPRTVYLALLACACGERDPGTKERPLHPTSAESEAARAFRHGDVEGTLDAWRKALEEKSVPVDPVEVAGSYLALFARPRGGKESDEFLVRAIDALEEGREAAATRVLLTLITKHAHRAEGHLLAALQRLRAGEHRLARGFLSRVPATVNDDWRIPAIQAVTFWREGRDEAAKSRLLQALSLAPLEPTLAYYAAREHLRSGNEGASRSTLEKVRLGTPR